MFVSIALKRLEISLCEHDQLLRRGARRSKMTELRQTKTLATLKRNRNGNSELVGCIPVRS